MALLSASLFAIVTGAIRGRITDPSGAAIPGATVKVVNLETGLTRTVTSNAQGAYALLALPTGPYNVTVRKPGFNTYTRTRVPLTVGETYVVNARMAIGHVSQTVEVNATALQVNTTNAQLGTVVSSQQITTLPLVGRDWLQLQQLQPGVVSSSDRFGTYSTNGNRTQANDYLLNGMTYNDFELNTAQTPPSPDSISQFRMATSVMDVQYGHNSGAVISASTKNGTNQFHGDAFEFYRDTSLDAAGFFANASGGTRAPFHQNEFGGTIGGPIIHNKTFFFFSYQGLRNKTGTSNTTNVFTPAQRSGVWGSQLQDAIANEVANIGAATVSPRPLFGDSASNCTVSSGIMCPAGTLYSSLFSTGTIPTQDFDPLAAKLMQQFVPLPSSTLSNGTGQFTFPTANIGSDDQYIWRIDQDFSSSDQMFFVGHWETNPTTETLPFTGATLPGWPEVDAFHLQDYTLSETHVFGPTMINQFHVGYLRQNFGAVEPVTSAAPSAFGFQNIIPEITQGASMPYVFVNGYFDLGFSINGPQPRIEQVPSLKDNFSWIHGSHNLKFGVEIRHPQTYNPFAGSNNGQFSFGGSGQFSTGLAAADFLLGLPDYYYQTPGGVIDAYDWSTYVYAQDEWHATPDLTLTLGTGWQITTPWVNTYFGGEGTNGWRPGEQSKIFPTAPAGLVYPGDPGMTESGYYTHYKNFSPVAAFAWAFAPRWSLRGGYGLFYNATEEEGTLQTLGSPPFGFGQFNPSPEFANPFMTYVQPTAAPPTTQAVAQTFPFKPPKPGSSYDFTNIEPMELNVWSPNYNIPYNENFNLTLQHQLSNTMLMTLSYVGSYGRRLEAVMELNPYVASECLATPGCGPGTVNQYNVGLAVNPNVISSIGEETNMFNSSYNSFQAELRKSFGDGLMFQASYTFMHATDQGSSYEGAWGGVDPYNLNYSYGDSDYDQPQRLVLNYIYDIPGSHFFPALTRGWEVAGITTFQSGLPFSIENGFPRDLECTPGASYYGCWDRPNQTGPETFYTNPRSAPDHAWMLPGSFVGQPLGTNGDAGRNEFHGPGLADYDFSLIKNTQLTEGKSLQLRFEFYNLFNHTNFANPDNVITDTTFGQISSIQGNPRRIQLGAKIIF